MRASRFEDAYKGTPPWDIGRAQPAFERVADAGLVTGPVLDAGCGTGENALFFAARGFEVVGVDAVEAAVAAARAKAQTRGLQAEFLVHDALALGELGRRFARSSTPGCSTPSTTTSGGSTSRRSRPPRPWARTCTCSASASTSIWTEARGG